MGTTSDESPSPEDIQAQLSVIDGLLGSDPVLAEARAGELLQKVPGQPMALLFQGIARRQLGHPTSALDVLRPLCQSWPDAPMPHLQLGLALREAGDNTAAADAMRRAVAIRPDYSDAWLALAELATAMEDAGGADEAFGMYIRYAAQDARLQKPMAAVRENRLAEAESHLRRHLERHPVDVAALCMLADIAARQGEFGRSQVLLRKCLDLAPSYRLARHNYAVVLMRQHRPAEALEEIDRLLAESPTTSLRNLKAAVLVQLARYEDAVEMYEGLLRDEPGQPGVWASLGHALRTVGEQERCVRAYRKSIELAPDRGEAYWNLANLKTFQIGDAELQAMREQLAKPGLAAEDRIHFEFAVGKATADRGEFAESFRHYGEGNRLRRRTVHYEPDAVTAHVRRSRDVLTRTFFVERAAYGAASEEPILIVGMPRAGSTLVEQILASHSMVEGTMELPHVSAIAKSLAEQKGATRGAGFADALLDLGEDESRAIGQAYVDGTRALRRGNRPFFIDKMPNNFAYLGLIHLILPNARVIDVRRHPLACGLSLFTHLFSQGQYFSYSLDEIGRYYRDYTELMSHFDAVLPGRVHRVIYESLVEDTESEVRRLLEYCGLPFEESCLRFHENRRAVSTPSSEQVRAPIFRAGLDHWRNYEPWLDPLKATLGPLVDKYPDAPATA